MSDSEKVRVHTDDDFTEEDCKNKDGQGKRLASKDKDGKDKMLANRYLEGKASVLPQAHSSEAAEKCELCTKSFPDPIALLLHVCQEHNDSAYVKACKHYLAFLGKAERADRINLAKKAIYKRC